MTEDKASPSPAGAWQTVPDAPGPIHTGDARRYRLTHLLPMDRPAGMTDHQWSRARRFVDGASIGAIARADGTTRQAVFQSLRSVETQLRGVTGTRAHPRTVVNRLRAEGNAHTVPDVARRFGISVNTVRQRANRLGLGRRVGHWLIFTDDEAMHLGRRTRALPRQAPLPRQTRQSVRMPDVAEDPSGLVALMDAVLDRRARQDASTGAPGPLAAEDDR